MAKKLMCAEVELTVSWPVLVDENATDDEMFDIVESQVLYDYCLTESTGADHPIKTITIYGTNMPDDPEKRAVIMWAIKKLENDDAQREADREYIRTHKKEIDASFSREAAKYLDRNVISFKKSSRLSRLMKESGLKDNSEGGKQT